MKMRWNLFLAAAFFGGYLLVSNGVPFAPVLAGIAAVFVLQLWKSRQSRVKR